MAELSEITQKIVSRNLDNFFDSIDIFVSKPKFRSKINDIFAEGLKVFLKTRITKSVSIHLLDENDFTFQHRLTLPNQKSHRSIEYFESFINDGFIGKTLNEGSAFYLNKNDNEFKNSFVFVPMIASWGIMGIILIELEEEVEDFESYFIKLFQMHTNILSSAIERVQLFDKMTTQNSMLEQKVAIRTHKLNQSQNETKAVFNAVQTGIFVCDRSGQIVNHNEKAYEILESEKSLIGTNFNDLLVNSERDNEAKIKTFSGKIIDILINHNQAQINDQNLIIYSILDISSRKIAQNALLELNKNLESIVNQRTQDLEDTVKQLEKEIDERYKAEQEIKKMLEQEKELNILKSKFIKTVSHEFRTPLTVIRSAAQLLEVYSEQLSKQEKDKYINRVINTVDFLTQLIENVLNLGKGNEFDQAKNTINLQDYFDNFFANQMHHLKERVILNLDEKSYVLGNIQSFNVIFANILSNAEKYSFPETMIKITSESDSNKTKVNIENEGIGIVKSDQKRIFDLFYRGENIGNISGIGIGLSVAKQCINLLDGSIYFSSKENEKTIFTVELRTANAK
jgi:hypothetical protein